MGRTSGCKDMNFQTQIKKIRIDYQWLLFNKRIQDLNKLEQMTLTKNLFIFKK